MAASPARKPVENPHPVALADLDPPEDTGAAPQTAPKVAPKPQTAPAPAPAPARAPAVEPEPQTEGEYFRVVCGAVAAVQGPDLYRGRIVTADQIAGDVAAYLRMGAIVRVSAEEALLGA